MDVKPLETFLKSLSPTQAIFLERACYGTRVGLMGQSMGLTDRQALYILERLEVKQVRAGVKVFESEDMAGGDALIYVKRGMQAVLSYWRVHGRIDVGQKVVAP